MKSFPQVKGLSILQCKNEGCLFIGLDLANWTYPYVEKDYYAQASANDINPQRPFVQVRANLVKRFSSGKRTVELGCGLGETALALADLGFEVWAVDESKAAKDFHRGRGPTCVHWATGGIEEFLRGSANKFDVITLFHVLEHIPQPKNIVKLLRESLNPNGIVIVEVPDVEGGLRYLKGAGWEYWLSHHVNYFSSASLKKLMSAVGFQRQWEQRMFHFGHPQGVWWKDIPKALLARAGINSIIRTVWRLQ